MAYENTQILIFCGIINILKASFAPGIKRRETFLTQNICTYETNCKFGNILGYVDLMAANQHLRLRNPEWAAAPRTAAVLKMGRLICDLPHNNAAIDDVIAEREGSLMGLACAGVAIEPIEISAESFLSWCAHSGKAISTHELDRFTGVVSRLRAKGANPNDLDVRPTSFEAQNRSRRDKASRHLPISSNLYREWRDCVSSSPMPISFRSEFERYGRLLCEFWCEHP